MCLLEVERELLKILLLFNLHISFISKLILLLDIVFMLNLKLLIFKYLKYLTLIFCKALEFLSI